MQLDHSFGTLFRHFKMCLIWDTWFNVLNSDQLRNVHPVSHYKITLHWRAKLYILKHCS